MSTSLNWVDAFWLTRRRTPNDRLRLWGSALSSAVTTALVCTAAGLYALGAQDVASTLGVVAQHGTRGGVVIAVLLVALPALRLTGQTWKLGSVERRQRLGQLRDAGAGPGELQRVVVADTVVPVALGAVVGVLALGLTIAVLNLRHTWMSMFGRDAGSAVATGESGHVPGLVEVPNVVIVAWWPAVLSVALVTAAASLVASRSVRGLDRAHRQWPSVLGLTAAAGAGCARRPALLIALRRIANEPRATSRPALLLGLAAFIAGASTWLSRQFQASYAAYPDDAAFYSQSFTLIQVATCVGIGLCGLGLVVTLTDAVLRRRRADATAIAAGVPMVVLRRALVLQATLPAVLPVALGLYLGAVMAQLLTGPRADTWTASPQGALVPLPWVAWTAWGIGILLVAGIAALISSTALTRTTHINQMRVAA